MENYSSTAFTYLIRKDEVANWLALLPEGPNKMLVKHFFLLSNEYARCYPTYKVKPFFDAGEEIFHQVLTGVDVLATYQTLDLTDTMKKEIAAFAALTNPAAQLTERLQAAKKLATLV